jgi:hypothetical protein
MPAAYEDAHPLRHVTQHAIRSRGFHDLGYLLQQGKRQSVLALGRSSRCGASTCMLRLRLRLRRLLLLLMVVVDR